MKKIGIFLILSFLLALPLVFSLENCQPIESLITLPCLLVSTWQYPTPCSNHYLTVINSTNATVKIMNFSDFSNNYCYLNFSVNQSGSYFGKTDLNDTISINIIGGDDMIDGNFLMIGLLLIWVILLFLSFITRIPMFLILTALYTCGMGIWFNSILGSGFIGWFVTGLFWLIGIVFMAYSFVMGKR